MNNKDNKQNKDAKYSFWYGFLLSIGAWILSAAIIALIPNGNGERLSLFINFALGLLFIWVPLAIICGFISKNKGRKSANWFVGANFMVSLLVVGGCTGIFRDYI